MGASDLVVSQGFASHDVRGQDITPMMVLLPCSEWGNALGCGHGDRPADPSSLGFFAITFDKLEIFQCGLLNYILHEIDI